MDPTPTRWRRIQEVFEGASELSAGERAGFLARECGDDAELQAEVRSLLEEADAGSSLSRAVAEEADLLLGDRLRGRRVGAYRIEAPVGQGGMGTVYLASRDDEAYRTRVAVKVLHGGPASALDVARFRDERQILATLEHPGIVRLLDGGATGEGLPFLVMEHIEGVPITRYADARGLGVRQRVELFLSVCAAVQYAHGKLVVHRDIKPANILVTPEGAPKLLDFGIARLLDAAPGVRAPRTRTGMQLLTPEYASPEQARGLPAATSTDIYSLGAVLYELLTGAPAHRPDGPSAEALMHAILQKEPARPSAVAPPARRRALEGDLDNIVLKALQKEPSRRYPSVERLAEDLRRHLDGLPVEARAGTLRYRAGKFVRRNRAAVAAALLAAAALSTSTVVSLRAARRADAEAQRAARRFADVRRLAESVVFELDERIRDVAGTTAARELLLRRALEYLEVLAREASGDPELLRSVAAAYMKVGDIQGNPLVANLGRPADGLESYARARAIIDRLIAAGDDDPRTRASLASALYGTAFLFGARRETEAMRAALEQAGQVHAALPPGAPIDRRTVAAGITRMAQLEFEAGHYAATEEAADRCLEVALAWLERSPGSEGLYWIGISQEIRAAVRSDLADPEESAHEILMAGTLFGALAAAEPQNAMYAREATLAQVRFARHAFGRGDGKIWAPRSGEPALGEAALRDAAARIDGLVKADPDNMAARILAGSVAADLAAAVGERDPAAALPLFERALAIHEALPPAFRDSNFTRQLEFYVHGTAAESFARTGRVAEARRHADQAVTMAEAVAQGSQLLDDQLDLLMARTLRGRVEQILGDGGAAATFLDVADGLERLIAAHPSSVTPRLGLIETLDRAARLVPAKAACPLRARARDSWRSWPLAQTRYTRRVQAQLSAATAGACPR